MSKNCKNGDFRVEKFANDIALRLIKSRHFDVCKRESLADN